MTTATQTSAAIVARTDTFDHLLRELGDVPPERVLVRPAPGTATEQDLLYLLEHEDRACELFDGVLVEKVLGREESIIALTLARLLGNYVHERQLGVMSGADGPMRFRVGLVRLPDVAFISWERIPGISSVQPIPSIIPDLTVEVFSRGNTRREMERKRKEYFDAGVRLAWFVDPKQRTVAVYTSASEPDRVLTATETLNGGTVVPGFELKLSELFSILDRLEKRPESGQPE